MINRLKIAQLALIEGNDPTAKMYKFDTVDEMIDLIDHWMEMKKEGSIYVCFNTWQLYESNEVEIVQITTTSQKEVVEINEMEFLQSFDFIGDIRYTIAEFANWDDALLFSMNLSKKYQI